MAENNEKDRLTGKMESAAPAKPRRIGINALYLLPGGVGGTEIYLRGLLAALAEIDAVNEYFIFTNKETGPDLVPAKTNFHFVPQHVRATFRPARILWEQTALPMSVARRHVDVLLNPGFTSPVFCSCPMVTVFHDVQHKRHPEYFRWFDLPFWNILLYASAHRSTLLLADSEATRDDLLKYYRLPSDRIRVARLGVDSVFFTLRKQPEKYLLCVSTLHPHKNLDSLIRAFVKFRQKNPEFRLFITGLRGFYTEQLEHLRDSLKLKDSVTFTGWIAREELHNLYAHAFAFLYPSTFEGFGLPVLEALAVGLPTACSRIDPLCSTVGDAALLFDPLNEEEIFKAMTRLVSDEALRMKLEIAGPQRAAQFSWLATARITLDALLSVTSQH